MAKFCAALVALLLASACSGKSPAAPSTPLGTFGAQVSSVCAAFPNAITSVVVTIDGATAGTATPGGAAVTKQVGTGNHSVSGVANTGLRWDTDNRTLTTSAPDFIVTFACAAR